MVGNIGNNENENENDNENDNCKNNNKNKNNGNNSSENDDGTKSIVLNLVKLSKEYDIVLIKYNQAQKDYINYLKTQSGTTACKKYNSDSKEIDQACYEEIWEKAGCTTTGVVDASTDWAKGSTLNGLIYDAFLWATMTDTDHRNGCYGTTTDTSVYSTATEPNYNINSGSSTGYTIIGVGTDGKLYSRPGLNDVWSLIQDNSSGLTSVCTMNDGKGILASKEQNILQKSSYTSDWSEPISGSCCVLGVAMGEDGTIIGIGTDNTLFSKSSLTSDWEHTSTNEWLSSICIAPDGSIFCVGSNSNVYKKNSYKNLLDQEWVDMGSCCVKAITVAPDGTFIGVGTDNNLYSKPSYTDLSVGWSGPYENSCCVIGITTVSNPKTENLIDIKGATFWGTGLISERESNSVDECKALCSADESCTGATYNSDKAYCWLRSGEGSVNTGLPNDYAIIPENLKYLKVIQALSEKLTSINDQVLQAMNNGNPLYSAQDMARKKQTAILNLNYKKLTKEREKVEETIKKYQELNKSQNLGYTFINKNYSTFITTVIIVIILIILFIKFLPTQTVETVQQGGGLKNNKYILILILTMCFVTFLIWNKFLVRQNCPLLQKNRKNDNK